jgi:CubicO group peptidase (beta-lactamase class C family)
MLSPVSMPHEPSAGRALFLILICLVPLLAGRAAAAAAALPDDYRHAFEGGAANGAWGGGIAVGLIDGNDQAEWFFGKAADGVTPDRDSAFEIGAATDVLTGLLVAQAVLEGKLRLGWTLRQILPADFPWRDERLAATTVEDLVTQHSLLPPGPTNLFPLRAEDPYSDYRQSDLLAWLANVQMPTPAAGAGYSILNGGVLGLLLARVHADDYPNLMAARILVSLGMTHTGFDDSGRLLSGRAFGQPVAHWHFDAFAGAAGLRSSLGDLLGFVRANLRPEGSSLRAALLLARQARSTDPGGGIGFGWNVHEVTVDQQSWPLVWRASVTGGFSTFIGFRTDRQQGLVLLAASATELAPIGLAWLSGESAPGTPAPPYSAPAGQAARYPGLYRLLNGPELTVRSAAEALSAQLRGQPSWPLFPIADDVYATRGGAILITFLRNVDEINGLLLRTDGAYVMAHRLSVRAPVLLRTPTAIDAARLADLPGDFELDAGMQLRVSRSADGIYARYTGASLQPMRAYATDRFSADDGADELAFQRDEHGKVSGVTVVLGGAERHAQPIRWQVPRLPPYTAPVPVD